MTEDPTDIMAMVLVLYRSAKSDEQRASMEAFFLEAGVDVAKLDELVREVAAERLDT